MNVLLLGGSAARIARYLYKGRRVVIDGSLQSAQWEGARGEECEEVCVLARRIEFLGDAPEWVLGPDGDWHRCGTYLPGECTVWVIGFSEDIWL